MFFFSPEETKQHSVARFEPITFICFASTSAWQKQSRGSLSVTMKAWVGVHWLVDQPVTFFMLKQLKELKISVIQAAPSTV